MTQPSDIRGTALYREIEHFYGAIHAPGDECITDAADMSASPERRVGFAGTLYRSLHQPPITRICLVELDTGTLTVKACASGNDRAPRFSPDGQHLAFLSDRVEPGNFQLFLSDGQGEGPRAAHLIEGVIESLSWSPDGSRLLLGVAGFGADIAGCQGGSTTLQKETALPAWMPKVDTGNAENLWRVAYVFDVQTQQLSRLNTQGINIWESAWLGDQEILAIVSDSHSAGSWYTSRLIALDLAAGSSRPLFEPEDQIGVPSACPSGRYVAVIEAVCSDRMIVCGALRLLERRTGTSRILDTQR